MMKSNPKVCRIKLVRSHKWQAKALHVSLWFGLPWMSIRLKLRINYITGFHGTKPEEKLQKMAKVALVICSKFLRFPHVKECLTQSIRINMKVKDKIRLCLHLKQNLDEIIWNKDYIYIYNTRVIYSNMVICMRINKLGLYKKQDLLWRDRVLR